uniref:ATP synthase subunit C lysine N-methyltransferase-like n=1 Tax=Geotrypetes seraphini TaxID=260995 RepID=A0A6P8PS54_GEOSA|nr:ATP synthase subunit C lysine N-methyltransferase-like [Geotrypetes seraphini]XP_033786734.1 ATP synthase subunit C lysine N-methyltransferase-like [Geotrypetes seraphini]XP_033786743.1 ATP synthase subunit C lysine N-methyltransferase-like [Geotrypetes seraphini]
MEDTIDMILLHKPTECSYQVSNSHRLTWIVTGIASGVYGLWALFVLPGFRTVPWKLKVPFLPSSKVQTENIMKLLRGRKGCLVDLGSGDGRLVLAAASVGFQSTGYELNPILLSCARAQAWLKGLSSTQASFVKEDFWKANLSSYNNVTVFLAPNVMETLEDKLSTELPYDARVIVCRFPFPHWLPTCSEGCGMDQVWAYDMQSLRKQILSKNHHIWLLSLCKK